MSDGSEHWRDDPITSAAEDRLGRLELAKRVAKLVTETHSEDSSVVLGLVGPWGSGKSSVLALTEKQLAEASEDWVTIRFSPWATSDLNGLLAEFYAAIVEALPRKKGAANFKRGLAEVMAATAPLASVAGSLVGVSAVGDAVKKGGELLGRDKSWSARFSDASQALKKLGVKLLVIADDIDRLHGDDLLNFLRLVRLVGRFPGMSYLIAYDEAGLLASIEAAGSAVSDFERAQDFVEKFVQYPIYLPPLIEGQVIDLLNEALNPVIASSNHRFEAADGRLSLSHGWVDLLDTPRAINRFAAQLRLILPLHRAGEVDLVDVVLLTLVRLHAPQVFDSISRSKGLLLSSHSTKDPFDWGAIIGNRAPVGSSAAVQEIVERLFPGVDGRGNGKVDPPRAGNPDYFDRYFLQGIPDHDVADASVRLAIDQTNKGDGVYLDLLLRTAKTDAKRSAIVSKLQQFSTWGEEAGATPVVALKAVLKDLDSVPKKSTSLLPSAYLRAQRWAGQMLLCLPSDVTEHDVRDALASCKDEIERVMLLETVAYSGDRTPPAAVLSVAADAAMSLLSVAVDNVRQGDSADQLGLIERWTLLLREVALEDGRRRLAEVLAEGLSADDLAARFVAIAHWRGGHDEMSIEINGFLWDAFDDLLPQGLPTTGPDTDATVDTEDVSWPSRRLFALKALAHRRSAEPEQ
ncbi:KAP family NTPase [Microbacterium trichothecenolyticum]|uniref:KAP family NTPase n=1 Tax=Microbacterium trichothecenolyticum TaxID=69370 RepID=UPI001C6F521B|nr:KAP family NTPase [Microbacterium trichothecenolyticum]MBW9121239.1 KAP family NTPase [Microbacterium trichothecenolyticum]